MRAVARIYLIILGLPLFVYYAGGVYREISYEESANVLPVSLYVGTLLISAQLFFGSRPHVWSRALVFPCLVASASLIAYCAAELLNMDQVLPQVWLIYFVPMIVGLTAGTLVARLYSVRELLNTFSGAAALVALGHVVWSFLTMGVFGTLVQRGTTDLFGLFSIYQKFVYYPLGIMLANCYLIFFCRKTIWTWLGIGILFLESMIIAAREPFAFLLLFTLLYVTWARRLRGAILGVTLMGIVGSVVWANYDRFSEAAVVDKLLRLTSDDPSERTSGRIDLVVAQLGEARKGLIIGSGFTMSAGFKVSPHNQYVEYVLRGGLTFLILIVGILAHVVSASFGLAREDQLFAFFGMAFVCLLLVTFNINTPMRAPYSSMVIWTFSGFVLARRLAPTMVPLSPNLSPRHA